MSSKLIETRKPTPKERKEHGAEIIFVRKDETGEEHTIYGARCYESWEQWGARREILGDNVDTIEAWRRKQ